MFVASLILAAGLGAPFHQVEKGDGFELQGVAFSGTALSFFGTSETRIHEGIRVQGALPLDGEWSLRCLGVTARDGAPVKLEDTGWPNSTDPAGGVPELISGGTVVGADPPTSLIVIGELVHYRTVEETATFQRVQLESRPVAGGTMWCVPAGHMVTATTERGLILRFVPFSVGGLAGNFPKNWSALAVSVDATTLGTGLRDELLACHAGTPDRVDVEPAGSYHETHLYAKVPEIGRGVFCFTDEEFTRDVALRLQVKRRIVDRRYPFTFLVPVQKDKSWSPHEKENQRTAKTVRWPSPAP